MAVLWVTIPGGATLPVRWRGYIPVLGILAVLCVIPHDPSTRLQPDAVGGDAMRVSASGGLPKAPTPRLASRTPSPACSVGILTNTDSAAKELEWWSRLARCAAYRPLYTARHLYRQTDLATFTAGCSRSRIVVPQVADALVANASALGLYVTVEELRSTYGTGRDLTPRQTRALYHSLLPTALLEDAVVGEVYSLADRAQLAIAARRAAKLYARERAVLPAAIGSEVFDGVRRLAASGSFEPGGITVDEVWQKYAGYVPREGETLPNDVYYTVLRKACTCNSQIDALCGLYGEVSVAGVVAAEVGDLAEVMSVL